MEFIVKCSNRWKNGFYYRQMSFNDILATFGNDEQDEQDDDVDELIANVANMNVNAVYSFDFFMNDTYTFRRIK